MRIMIILCAIAVSLSAASSYAQLVNIGDQEVFELDANLNLSTPFGGTPVALDFTTGEYELKFLDTNPERTAWENGIGGNSRFYGYGLILSDELICHEGYIVGFRSYFIVDPKEELFIAIFSNNTTNNPKQISSGLLNIMKISESSK